MLVYKMLKKKCEVCKQFAFTRKIDWVESIIKNPLRRIRREYRWLKRMIDYFILIRHQYDIEIDQTFDLITFKLKRLRKSFLNTNAGYLGIEDDIPKIEEAIRLLEKASDEDNFEEDFAKHREKYGELVFETDNSQCDYCCKTSFYYSKCKDDPAENKKAWEERKRIQKEVEIKRKEMKKEALEIIVENVYEWWI